MKPDERSRVLTVLRLLGFDSSLIDIFPALIAGAQLIVPSEEQRRHPSNWLETAPSTVRYPCLSYRPRCSRSCRWINPWV